MTSAMTRSDAPLRDVLPPELMVLVSLHQPERWSQIVGDVDWVKVGELAAHHRLQGKLARALPAATQVEVPERLLAELVRHRERTASRFATKALPQIEEVCSALVDHDVQPTLLKGTSMILSGLAAASERPISDIDVLVPRLRARVAQAALDQLGYRTRQGEQVREWAWNNHYQDAPLHHPDRRLSIDLHWHIQPRRHRIPFPIDTMQRVPLELPSGLVVQRFANTDELAHLCLHFWKDREQGRAGALGQLWDIHAAAGRLTAQDWTVLATRSQHRGHARTVAAVLAIAHLLLETPVPPGFRLVGEMAADERTSSFAIRRVLAPRPEHIQLLMVTPGVAYTPARVLARVFAYLRRPSDRLDDAAATVTSRWHARFRHVRFTLSCLSRSLSAFRETRAEMGLDHWAHELDTIDR